MLLLKPSEVQMVIDGLRARGEQYIEMAESKNTESELAQNYRAKANDFRYLALEIGNGERLK